MTQFGIFSYNARKSAGQYTKGVVAPLWPFVFTALLICGFFNSRPAQAESFRTIVIRLGYNHTKFAPEPAEKDIVFRFAAYTTCFDGQDDDNGNGTPDKWGIPHWVAYEVKPYAGQLPAQPGWYLKY